MNSITSLPSEEFDPKKYWRTLQRRWPLALLTTLSTIALAALAASTQKPSFEATGKLLIESDRKSSLTGVGGKVGTLESLKREATPLDTQAMVLRSSPLRARVIEVLQLKDNEGKLLSPDSLPIEVEVMVGTDVLQVKYKTPQATQSAMVVNELMKAYIVQNLQLNNTEATQAKSFVEKELPDAKRALDQASQALAAHRMKYKIVSLDKESLSSVDMVQRLNEQIQQVQAQLAEVQAQQGTVQGQIQQPRDRSLQAADLSQNPAVQSALAELRQAESKLASERSRYKPGHPQVEAQRREVDALSARLRQRLAEVAPQPGPIAAGQLQVGPIEQKTIATNADLAVKRSGLAAQLVSLEAAKTKLTGRQTGMPEMQRQEEALKQQQDLAQKNYNALGSKLAELRLAEIQSVANARIIQPALPALKPSYKSRDLLLVAGAGLGLCLGVAVAFAVDMLDRHLKTPDEIRRALGYPIVGMIPRFSTVPLANRPSLGFQHEPAFVQEAFRMLQTNLQFLTPDALRLTRSQRQGQTIVVSSAQPNEGKSTTTAHLAATLAQSGYRVLLIDGDFHAPIQHQRWDVPNTNGLSHWVVSHQSSAAIVQPVLDNLDLMTAGATPPNSALFFESEAFQARLKGLAPRYDYVLIDAPPLLGGADAVLLNKVADGLLLVARLHQVDDRSARAVQDLVQRTGCKVLGLVINCVNPRRDASPLFSTSYRARNAELTGSQVS
jgi:polysaccharide biosynthesis transport protein